MHGLKLDSVLPKDIVMRGIGPVFMEAFDK
jgi:hypothetical protein